MGLPPEAVTWRKDRYPPAEEISALAAEHQDAWSRAMFAALRHVKRVEIPDVLEIARPGDPDGGRDEVISDPAEIRRWFAENA